MKRTMQSLLFIGLAACLIAPSCPSSVQICLGYEQVLIEFWNKVIPVTDGLVGDGVITGPLLQKYQTFGKGQLFAAYSELSPICTRLGAGAGGDVGELEFAATITRGSAGMMTVMEVLEAIENPLAQEWKGKLLRLQRKTAKKLAKEK